MLLVLLSWILGLQPMHEMGYKGEGKTIAVIDCGFYNANQDSLLEQDQIIGVYDLLKEDSISKPDIFTRRYDSHGANCLSIMLAQKPFFTGTAPGANYIIIRTEDYDYEYYGEVERLAKGMLLADSLGADIITISLGYSTFDDGIRDFSYKDMDGKSNIASRTATALARKGRLICVAAGNYGNDSWHYITCPADADSILTVGSCSQDTIPAASSGWGPSYDGRQKPEICAWGQNTHYLNMHDGTLATGSGTSYACPEIAGMAACLWQALPGKSAMEIRDLIIQSGHLYGKTPYNYQLGNGVPNAYQAYLLGGGLPTDISERTENTLQPTQKILYQGQIYILRDGDWYDLMGRKRK